jgi:peptidoglycan/LPS O-acetylase OafA/YrhL
VSKTLAAGPLTAPDQPTRTVAAGPLTAPDQPTRAVGRFAALEGYRGLAALLVVVFHVYQFDRVGFPLTVYPYAGTPADYVLRNLDSMVDLFLVLSAFLLGLPFARAVLGDAPDQVGRGFLQRRAFRIIPVYMIAVTVVWASRNFALPGDWRDLLEHLTFTSTFDQKRFFYTIGPAWSLAVEVQFYLLLALLGVGAQRIARRLSSRRARAALLLSGVGGMAAISIGFKYWFAVVDPRPGTDWTYWFSLPAKLDVFACGALLAVLCALGTRAESTGSRWTLRLGALLVVGAAFVLRQPNSTDTWFHSVCAVGFALLLASHVLTKPDRWSASMNWSPFVFLGLVSYSLYLWHEPVLLWLASHGIVPAPSAGAFPVTAIVVVAASVIVASLSFYALEKPTMLLSKAFDRHGRPVDYYTHVGS